jgi:hypothetical protein
MRSWAIAVATLLLAAAVFGAERVGIFLGAILCLWILSRVLVFLYTIILGEARNTYWVPADLLAFSIAVFVSGYGFADGGPPRFWYAVAIYSLPLAYLATLDWSKRNQTVVTTPDSVTEQ